MTHRFGSASSSTTAHHEGRCHQGIRVKITLWFPGHFFHFPAI